MNVHNHFSIIIPCPNGPSWIIFKLFLVIYKHLSYICQYIILGMVRTWPYLKAAVSFCNDSKDLIDVSYHTSSIFPSACANRQERVTFCHVTNTGYPQSEDITIMCLISEILVPCLLRFSRTILDYLYNTMIPSDRTAAT